MCVVSARQHACNKKKKHYSHESPTTKRTSKSSVTSVALHVFDFSMYVVHCLCGVLVDASARRGTRSCTLFSLPPALWSMKHMCVITKGWAPQHARAHGFFLNHVLCFTKIRFTHCSSVSRLSPHAASEDSAMRNGRNQLFVANVGSQIRFSHWGSSFPTAPRCVLYSTVCARDTLCP